MKLNLPYPVSANRYWRSYKSRDGYVVVVPSREAVAYKKEVWMLARSAGLQTTIPGRLEVRIILHPRKPKTIRLGGDPRCIDLDNALKVTLDAMNGVAYEDDSQIRRIAIERGEPIENGGLSVQILRYELEAA